MEFSRDRKMMSVLCEREGNQVGERGGRNTEIRE